MKFVKSGFTECAEVTMASPAEPLARPSSCSPAKLRITQVPIRRSIRTRVSYVGSINNTPGLRHGCSGRTFLLFMSPENELHLLQGAVKRFLAGQTPAT